MPLLMGADGKAYVGGGAVVMDADGINIHDQALWFIFDGTTYGSMHSYESLDEAHHVIITLMNDANLEISGGGCKLFDGYMDLSSAGFVLPVRTSDPADPPDGAVWFRSDL